MAKISACVISYNEEDKIEDCLVSLSEVADEILVVDSISTDRTTEIASRLADRVIDQPFLGYVEQKNFAVENASHDWILSLDCDERLSPELRSDLLREKERLGKHAAYEMPRRTFYVDRWMNHCWYPDRRVRLFNRTGAWWGGGEPHDSVHVDGGSVARLKGDILHYSFDSVSDHLQTIDRFTEIAARGLFEDKRRVSALAPVTYGAASFFKSCLLKRGFLDGLGGLVVSVLSATAVFTRYAKLLYLYRSGESALRQKATILGKPRPSDRTQGGKQ